ncbi:BolA/IbaG family iron-sulfur metabolism protein [Pseudomonas sp. MAP12]|uniref:BolA/IbaG family iron-sulfur metabolism protein n=1 Tax=Geopseudomonas aromaticivorans TaxID=2849492 RepID=A0ABS6MRQ2_9GAMM|nr:BolA/IbaG family iron-sulfur metabolism protein [Pseudomonas aromaticivorans]MBV2131478.1 BolA/IbaG family iron-sulfur metabolism protein [Pseudomonas aromaticivorans]
MSMQEQIQQALAALEPQHLEVLNESHMHSRGQESHFKAVVVSPLFAGLNAVKRHQKVYASLGALMGSFHALALHTYTPEEWAAQGAAPASPTCMGGSKHDRHAH